MMCANSSGQKNDIWMLTKIDLAYLSVGIKRNMMLVMRKEWTNMAWNKKKSSRIHDSWSFTCLFEANLCSLIDEKRNGIQSREKNETKMYWSVYFIFLFTVHSTWTMITLFVSTACVSRLFMRFNILNFYHYLLLFMFTLSKVNILIFLLKNRSKRKCTETKSIEINERREEKNIPKLKIIK